MEWKKNLMWVEEVLAEVWTEEKKYDFGIYDPEAPSELLDMYLGACLKLEELVEYAQRTGKVNYLKKLLASFPRCAYEIAQEFVEFRELLTFNFS